MLPVRTTSLNLRLVSIRLISSNASSGSAETLKFSRARAGVVGDGKQSRATMYRPWQQHLRRQLTYLGGNCRNDRILDRPRPYAMTQRASPTARSFETITAAIGTILDSFRSQECRNYLANSECQQTRNHHALGGTSRNSYKTPFAASTMWRAEIPNASTSSSGLPECGIPLTAISLNFVGAAPAATKACKTASPNPPSGQ